MGQLYYLVEYHHCSICGCGTWSRSPVWDRAAKRPGIPCRVHGAGERMACLSISISARRDRAHRLQDALANRRGHEDLAVGHPLGPAGVSHPDLGRRQWRPDCHAIDGFGTLSLSVDRRYRGTRSTTVAPHGPACTGHPADHPLGGGMQFGGVLHVLHPYRPERCCSGGTCCRADDAILRIPSLAH